MKQDSPTAVSDHSFAGLIGVARCDITPPIGIYNRMWGAAKQDRVRGVHRPITATALAIRQKVDDPPLLLIAIDWCTLTAHSAAIVMPPLLALAGDAGRVIMGCSHTHGVGIGFYGPDRYALPGGDLLLPAMEATRDKLAQIARDAIASSAQTRANVSWASGRCSVATNRDLADSEPGSSRILCGFNPAKPTDDTVLVGRITRDSDNQIIATIVNYACHPTTLGWDCGLLSPDYIGAMRETVESHTGGAPCLFLQGASGDLAPAHQYVGDTNVADRYGRALGHSALAALESLLAPRRQLTYQGPVESGAPLAYWDLQDCSPSDQLRTMLLDVALPLAPAPPLHELERDISTCGNDRVRAERLRRKINIARTLGTGPTATQPAWVWRLGDAVICAQPNEPYSVLQQNLRAAFKDQAIIFLNAAGVSNGYLYPNELAGLDLYPVWQSPFAPGSLELLQTEFERAIRAVSGA